MNLSNYFRRLELEACRWLAGLRWGPTGWRCPCCPSTDGTQLTSRPRVTQCDRCGAQRSVSAGTVFGHAKLPLFLLLDLLRKAFALPTATELHQCYGVARSTAWYVMQRAFKILSSGFDGSGEVPELHQRLSVLLRTPGRRPLPAAAPAWFRERQRERLSIRVPFRVDASRDAFWLGHLGPDDHVTTGCTVVPQLAETVNDVLERRRVSLRWGPRWITALLAAHLFESDEHTLPFGFWAIRGLRLPHVPRTRFEPWHEPGPW